MITDDIHKVLGEGRIRHAGELFMALRHLLDQHVEARAGLAEEPSDPLAWRRGVNESRQAVEEEDRRSYLRGGH